MRLSMSSLAGTERTLVAVGTARLAVMLAAVRAAVPRSRAVRAGRSGRRRGRRPAEPWAGRLGAPGRLAAPGRRPALAPVGWAGPGWPAGAGRVPVAGGAALAAGPGSASSGRCSVRATVPVGGV